MINPGPPRRNVRYVGRRALILALRTWSLLIVLMAASTSTAAGGQADVAADARWLPWLGCWQLVEETGPVGPVSAVANEAEGPDGVTHFAERVVVCLSPAGAPTDTTSVDVTTMAGGEPVLVETLWADGIQHAVTESACTGFRRNTWSDDGVRLFARAELACADAAEDARQVSGVGFMTSATTWLDIQLVSSGDRGEVTVRRYRRASASTTLDAGATPLPDAVLDQALKAARLASTSQLDVNDIVEAGKMAHPAVVEAMLVETQATVAIDGRALIQLADGGVPTEVIDLMVALSFPDEFVVGRPPARTTTSYAGGGGGFADQYGPYGYDQWYPYYASPFGYYSGWSPYSSLYYFGPSASYVILPGGFGPDTVDRRSAGRAYPGRGYSQIGVREPTTNRRAQPRNRGGNIASSQGASRGGSSSGGSRGGSSSGGSSGGGRATPGGYTRGGSSGRTATPRN
ncbi:MAG: hypothetical protein QF681_05410 [Vicinamibacterales bacterium]|jgi:uncharacterized membrane protein YgcG|nr:hypothetical protein [Vicinamibacterales bacterium]